MNPAMCSAESRACCEALLKDNKDHVPAWALLAALHELQGNNCKLVCTCQTHPGNAIWGNGRNDHLTRQLSRTDIGARGHPA